MPLTNGRIPALLPQIRPHLRRAVEHELQRGLVVARGGGFFFFFALGVDEVLGGGGVVGEAGGLPDGEDVVDGDVETGSVMAGQSVGMVRAEQPAAEIIGDLVAQAVAALAARGRPAYLD